MMRRFDWFKKGVGQENDDQLKERENKESGSEIILRRPLGFGKLFSGSLLTYKIDFNPDHDPNLSELIGDGNYPRHIHDVKALATILRDLVWQLWSSRTAFPYVRDQAEPGEPLGQCLVTSRLAKNYFENARMVEVQVRQSSGQIVGPHIVLELPILVAQKDGSEKIILFYLDLTSDQALALGNQSQVEKSRRPWEKVKLVEKDSVDNPYIFLRYREDDQLKLGMSKPLPHSSLLFEMFAYRYRSERIEGIERYAHDYDTQRDQIPEPLISRIHEATLFLDEFKKNVMSESETMPPTLQIGMISLEEFSPAPEWLWEVSGLRAFTETLLMNEGSPQALYFFIDDQIVIINFFGAFNVESLLELTNILCPENEKMRVLYAPSNLFAFLRRRGMSGPLMVK